MVRTTLKCGEKKTSNTGEGAYLGVLLVLRTNGFIQIQIVGILHAPHIIGRTAACFHDLTRF